MLMQNFKLLKIEWKESNFFKIIYAKPLQNEAVFLYLNLKSLILYYLFFEIK